MFLPRGEASESLEMIRHTFFWSKSLRPSWKISPWVISLCLGLLGENSHIYQVLKVFKCFPVKEAVRTLRVLPSLHQHLPMGQEPISDQSGAVRPCPSNAIGVRVSSSFSGPVSSCSWLGWPLALVHSLVCWGLPMDPVTNPWLCPLRQPWWDCTVEEGWDCAGSCLTPQPQQCRSGQIL